jgi:hypothetical protein
MFMTPRRSLFSIIILFSTVTAHPVGGAIVYEQDFEGETLASINYYHFTDRINDDQNSHAIIATAGIGRSAGLVHEFDGSKSVEPYALRFGRTVLASGSSPLGNATSLTPSQLKFSADIKSIGHTSNTPIQIELFQGDGDYEAQAGFDTNGDGDLNDAARFLAKYSPLFRAGLRRSMLSF